MTRARSLGLVMAVLTFLAVSGLAIWEDGRRFASANEQFVPAPGGVADASYLDASRMEWKTADELHEYAREHRLGLVERIEENRTP